MKKGTVVILIAVVAAGFFALGNLAKKGGSSDKSAASAEKADSKGAPADGIERYRVARRALVAAERAGTDEAAASRALPPRVAAFGG